MPADNLFRVCATIYRLVDPLDELTKYVGETYYQNFLHIRLTEHIYEARTQRKSLKHLWLANLYNKGIIPLIEPCEVVYHQSNTWDRDYHSLDEIGKYNREMNRRVAARENYWILYYLEKEHPLTNLKLPKLTQQQKETLEKAQEKLIATLHTNS